MTLKKKGYKVLVNGNISKKFNVNGGLKQGDSLLRHLLNVGVLDRTIKETGILSNPI